MTFTTGGIDIPVETNINKRLKYIRLSVSSTGVKISLPKNLDDRSILAVLNSKSKWICEHYIKYKSMEQDNLERKWQTGEKLLYRGKYINIEVKLKDCKNPEVSFGGSIFHIYVSPSLYDQERKNAIDEAVKGWYIDSAREIINERLVYYRGIINVRYNTVRIKEQKTRWGSCSKKGNLNFNWRIILAPPGILDYVVVHELAHLVYMDHSKNFWHTVSKYMPDYKDARLWLRKNGEGLMI